MAKKTKESLPTEGMYCGIADCHGIESLILVEDAEIDFLFMRTMSNPQRCATVYRVTLSAYQVSVIGAHLKKGKYVSALRALKTMQRGDSQDLGKLKTLEVENPKFWKKIPNPDLDPYYETKTLKDKIEARSQDTKSTLNKLNGEVK